MIEWFQIIFKFKFQFEPSPTTLPCLHWTPALKDKIKALHQHGKRKRIQINVVKSEELVFSKGSRSSRESTYFRC